MGRGYSYVEKCLRAKMKVFLNKDNMERKLNKEEKNTVVFRLFIHCIIALNGILLTAVTQ